MPGVRVKISGLLNIAFALLLVGSMTLKGDRPALAEDVPSAKVDKAKLKFMAIVTTPSGRFYGLDNSGSEESALKRAQRKCRDRRDEKAATKEEADEKCSVKASIGNGCVALSRGADAAGIAAESSRENAIAKAHANCEKNDGTNCALVRESVKCAR